MKRFNRLTRSILRVLLLFGVNGCFIQYGFDTAYAQKSVSSSDHSFANMTEEEYQQVLHRHDRFHAIIRAGDEFMESKQYEKALKNYLQAFDSAKGSSLEGIARGQLADLYERMGRYKDALEHVEWFLSGLQKEEPLWQTMVAAKVRLLGKIKENSSDNQVEKIKSDLRQLSTEEQKSFVDSLSNESIEGLFKQAMSYEMGGEFAKALEVYETLLGHQDQIEQQVNAHAWAMLYPGIQRTAELSGNAEKEKQALLWTRDQLLSDKGEYASSANYLEAATIQHLKERIHYWGLDESK